MKYYINEPNNQNWNDVQNRLDIQYVNDSQNAHLVDRGEDIIQGLTQKQKVLPARYFYDSKGSQLFEQICELPEYYLTRTEAKILEQYAPEIAQLTGHCELVELGSGSSTKTRLLLDSYLNNQYPIYYTPIDVSSSILEESAKQLLLDYPTLKIRGKVGTYTQALQSYFSPLLPNRMVIFLGSSLGNFNQQQCDRFFSKVTEFLNSGDYFLLGIDLQKSVRILEAAYNDSQGVTAAFNLNMLSHLNYLFEGNFDLKMFSHQAIYNTDEHQIEMHLICQKNHFVDLERLDLTIEFTAGETIRTEISRKFNLQQMKQQLLKIGLNPVQSWTDAPGWFGLLLCKCVK